MSNIFDIKEEKKVQQILSIIIDADQVRHSHILQMKEYFRSSSGNIAIRIEFLSKEQSLGNIKIQENWGIQFTPQLEEKLKKIGSIKQVQLEVK